jgi:hypothetical protein
MSSGAPVKVLYRAGSDLSSLHGSSAVERVEVDTDDLDGLVSSLENVDVLMYVSRFAVPPSLPIRSHLTERDTRLISDLAPRHRAVSTRVDR